MLWIVLASVLAAHAAASISKQDCPSTIPKDNWTQVHGNVCYRFELDIKEEYEDAREYCTRRGGTLALVKSKEINDFITGQLLHRFGYKERVWIGLNDKEDENTFVWEDGTPMKYNNFVKGDEGPRGGLKHFTEDCVAIDAGSNGVWRDYKCSDYFLHIVNEHKRFICGFQVDLPETTTTPPTTTTMKTTTTTMKMTTRCPVLICNLDCGLDGFRLDGKGCTICQCYGDQPLQTTTPRKETTTKETTTICPELSCNLDCGLDGLRLDVNGCPKCMCDGVPPLTSTT